jgi:hypothetical protein
MPLSRENAKRLNAMEGSVPSWRSLDSDPPFP